MTPTHAQEAPRLVTGLFISLDGIVEADEDWQFAYFDDELFAGIAAGWARAGAVLMGRHSFAGYDRLRHDHLTHPRSSSWTPSRSTWHRHADRGRMVGDDGARRRPRGGTRADTY